MLTIKISQVNQHGFAVWLVVVYDNGHEVYTSTFNHKSLAQYRACEVYNTLKGLQ